MAKTNILDKIVAHKKREVAARQELYPVKLLEQSIYFDTPVVSLVDYLHRPDKLGVIAEFKRQSPSKGPINPYASVERVSIGYMQAGASALSVLTDETFFGGSNQDLTTARNFNYCPILRKEFIIDAYQLVEARSIGADVVLLIAECLSAKEVKELAAEAHRLGLEVLLEVHAEQQLDKLTPDIDLLGVNNRDLETFTVNLKTSFDLFEHIPDEVTPISESGLNDPNAIVELRRKGYKGFLIGEHFMSQPDPGQACRNFIRRIQHIEDLLQNAIA